MEQGIALGPCKSPGYSKRGVEDCSLKQTHEAAPHMEIVASPVDSQGSELWIPYWRSEKHLGYRE